MDEFGKEKPTAATTEAADYRHRRNITHVAAAMAAANAELTTPIRMRFDNGLRPCSRCALSVDTAYNVADVACALCGQDFCKVCLGKHKMRCSIGHVVATKHQAAADDSTDDSDSADSESDIPIE